MKKQISKLSERHGVTIVEILIVITIMSVMVALILPRVRTVNKDRNIREAARVVGSAFANASDRAMAEGRPAGVLIVRNPNIVDASSGLFNDLVNANPVPYGATRLYQMKSVPNFTGDDSLAAAWLSPNSTSTDYICRIERPLDHDQMSGRFVVRLNDTIYLNNSRFGYRVRAVNEVNVAGGGVLDLTLTTAAPPATGGASESTYPRPNLPNTSGDSNADEIIDINEGGVPFAIERRPRVIRSSALDLPAGYQIDLRYSGWFEPPGSSTYAPNRPELMGVPNMDPDGDNTPNYEFTNVQVVFDEKGGIDSVDFGYNFNRTRRPFGSLQLFVAENDVEVDLNTQDGTDALTRGSNLWVSVNHLNGATSIGYSNPQNDSSNIADWSVQRGRVLSSRALATFRQDANQ